jgi:hypothetical protein
MPCRRHDPKSPLVSVEEAAELPGYSRLSLYRSIHKGDLPLPLIRIASR